MIDTTLTAAAELPTTWLLARSSGLLAYALLTLGVVAGLTLHMRLGGRLLPPAIVTTVHQSLSLFGLTAAGVHAAAILADSHVDVPLVAAVVPGMAGYRPLATAAGVVALELWLILHLSFRLRRRIGVARWRRLHRATFLTWALALGHGLTAGSDSGIPWVQQAYAGTAAVVTVLLVLRIFSSKPRPAPRPAARPAAPARPAATTTIHPTIVTEKGTPV